MLRAIYARCRFSLGLFTRIRPTLTRSTEAGEMISPLEIMLEIMPVLALALAIVLIPFISDGPPSL
jgi:hypothetical protein